MIKEYKYKNKDGMKFKINVEKGDVPVEADYHGFLLTVTTDEDNDNCYIYKALVKKTICPSEEGAKMWLNVNRI